MNLFEAAQELLPPGVRLERRGCLGRCGSGPNLALNPSGLLISYCATPAQLANLIERQCLGGDGTRLILHAFELRLQGNAAAERGKLAQAEALYTQALGVGAPRGDHLLLANRSSVRLQQGNTAGALEDALAAQAGRPADWTRGLVREAEARAAAGDAAGARAALDRASEIDAFILKDPDVAETLAAVSEETTFVSIEDDEYDSD
jgi:(2Fe-2S) ferredoxin